MKKCLLFLFLFPAVLSWASTDTPLQFRDMEYENTIKTVQFLHPSTVQTRFLNPDAVPISQRVPLFLEFDDLKLDAEYYFVRLIHCNADWTPSEIRDSEFLNQYNEFEVTDYEFSMDTRIPYVHYRVRVPRVQLPGNYLLVVYRNNDRDDIVLSKRLMVYEERVGVIGRVRISTGIRERDTHHELEYDVNYGAISLTDPKQEIYVVIRQNQRWDNALLGVKPAFIRIQNSQLEFRNFDLENNIDAGNEFRYFDLRTVNFAGEGVDRIAREGQEINAWLYKEKTKGNQAYSLPVRDDLNGQYVVADVDRGPGYITGEYVQVYFRLEHPRLPDDVYVTGAFDHWGRSHRMKYNAQEKLYEASAFVKQGWYNYQYLVDGPRPNQLEGSHRNTRNEYEILVYYRRIGARGDRLVGYSVLTNVF